MWGLRPLAEAVRSAYLSPITCADPANYIYASVFLTQGSNVGSAGTSAAGVQCTGESQTVIMTVVGEKKFKAGSVDYDASVLECYHFGCLENEAQSGTFQLSKA